MTEQTFPKRKRRMARERKCAAGETPIDAARSKAPSKLDAIEAMLLAETGASIAQMMATTGWQQHSVRGAMAGALKKRGLTISSDKIDGERRYRAARSA